jgi:hypothetical protein
MLGGLALERARKPPRASEERCGLGSGGCGGGSRFDPPDNVRPLQPALWLKGLADFPQDAMHDRVDANGAEARGFGLWSFLEFIRASNATAEYRRTSQRFSVAGRRAARRRRCRPAWSAFRIVEPPPG